MIQPDVIVSWPRNADYPLWRQFIHDNRQRFNYVIIVFTETNQGPDFRDFIREAMHRDYCHFVQSPPVNYGTEDWRDVAVHAGLMQSYNADWIWFTEQDFYPTPEFWGAIKNADDEGCEAIGVMDSARLHPCCLFLKRTALPKLNLNFGIVPDRLDHFGLIQQSILEQSIKTAIIPPNAYTHMAGLSHNMHLLGLGEAPNHQVEQFKTWLKQSISVTVPQDPRFIGLARAGLGR